MGQTKDIWGYHLIGPLLLPPTILAERRGEKYIRITKWLNPSERVKVASGEVYVGRWMVNEVHRITRHPHREAWIIENKDNTGWFAVVANRPKGMRDWPGIYEPDWEEQ